MGSKGAAWVQHASYTGGVGANVRIRHSRGMTTGDTTRLVTPKGSADLGSVLGCSPEKAGLEEQKRGE